MARDRNVARAAPALGPSSRFPTLTRRQFLGGLAGAAGAVALASCGVATKSVGAVDSYYRSRPDLKRPFVTTRSFAGSPVPGYIFVTAGSPMILDTSGEPVWIHPVPHASTNLRVQSYQGRPVLTWWQGEVAHYGVGLAGEYVMLDNSYRQVMTVHARNGLPADLHEFIISDDIAYFTAYHPFGADLRGVGGPSRGTALDATIQGVDLGTQELVFDWHSADHVALTESYATFSPKAPFDPVHVNSIDPTADGKLIVSARNTWAVYKLDPVTGEVIWRLGGKKSDFTLGSDVRFAWQHDAREHPGSVMTLFDDEANPPEAKQSRGLVLSVDETSRRVTKLRQYEHPGRPLLAGSQGSVQLLAGGAVLVGWGAEPYYSEYGPDASPVIDGRFGSGESYRALSFPWTGTPAEDPALAVERNGLGGMTAYTSWNGSTETAKWRAIGADAPNGLIPLKEVARRGFETTLEIPTVRSHVAVQALDADGRVLSTSPTMKL